MATPPPLNQNPKKKGCSKGCLLVGVIGFLGILLLGFISTMASNAEWKKNRSSIVASIEAAVEEGDYNEAFALAEPHESRNDEKIEELLSEASLLKEDAEAEIRRVRAEKKEQKRQERILVLLAEIEESKGDERKEKLELLLTLDPETEKYPKELASIRKERELLKLETDDFLTNGKGTKVPFKKWGILGTPETLEGTDNTHWIAYLPKADLSFVSVKTSDEVLFVGRGKESAPKYLSKKAEARKKLISKGFSSWDGSHRELTKVIKESMNDPKSYDHVETNYWDMGDHLVVRTTFRGKNAFGGVVKNSVRAKTDLDGNVLEIIE